MKHAFRSNPYYSQKHVNIDPQNGIISNVILAEKGLNKNGTYFSDRFLNELLQNATEKGYIKARFGHPNMCATSLGSYIGRFKNFKIENNAIYGDLHLDEISKVTQVEGRGISMFDYIIAMAQNNPDVFGNSICIIANSIEEQYEENGEIVQATGHKLIQWTSSDLVDDPAATNSLFHLENNDLGTLLTDFLDDNPQIFQIMEQKPSIVSDFLERYTHYQQRKNKNVMNIKKIFEKFTKNGKFDLDLTLANGDIISVTTQAEEPQVGDSVTQKTDNGEEAEKPLENGDYLLKDGKTLVVEDGKIKEIKEEEKAPAEPETPSEPESENLEEFAQEVVKTLKFFEKKITALEQSFAKIKALQSNYHVQEPNATSQAGNGKSNAKMSLQEIRERRNSYNQ